MHYLENRIPPLVVMIIVGSGMVTVSPCLPHLESGAPFAALTAYALSLVGLYFTLSGVAEFARSHTTVDPRNPEKTTQLVTTGIYGHSRNPMYLGFALFLCALVVFLQSPLLLSGVALFVAYMNRFQIGPEERIMTDKFGDQYSEYSASVRRWL